MKKETVFHHIYSRVTKLPFYLGISCILMIFVTSPKIVYANLAYVTALDNGSVTMIDTSTNTILPNTIPVGNGPIAIAITPNGQTAYVANNNSNTVSPINLSTNTAITSISTGSHSEPLAVAITPNGKFAYVANAHQATVSVINTGTNAIIATISGFTFPQGIAITPDGNFAYVTNGATNSVSVVSTSSNRIVGSPIFVGSNPFGIAITPNGNFAYVVNSDSPSVSVISTSSKTVVDTITTNIGNSPNEIAITPNGSFAYVINSGSNSVSVINTSNNTATVINSIIIPNGLAITPDGSSVYITSNNNTFYVVRTLDNVITNTVPFTNITTPYGIAIVPNPLPPTPPTPPTEGTQNSGSQEKNDFGIEYELVNTLTWQASSGAVAGYYVYRNGTRIATLSDSTFMYEDHNRQKGSTTFYSVTSFNSSGSESSPIYFEIN